MIVRKLRLKNGWTQDQLAEFCDISVRTIQRIEKGQPPSLESAKALAAVFEQDIGVFLDKSELEMKELEQQPTAEKLALDEMRALEYAKSVKVFLQEALAFVVISVVFIATFGFDEPLLFWVLGGVMIGVIVHGLFAFEVFRFTPASLEKWLAEKKLGRKL